MKFFTLALCAFGFSAVNSLECQSGQVPDSNNVCIEPGYMEGCYQYATASTCKTCSYRYNLTEEGRCEFTDIGHGLCCVHKDQYGHCKACNVGLHLTKKGQCVENPIIGCLEKDAQGNCKNCASDFILRDGSCEKGIKDCIKFADVETQKICEGCKNGYSLINNSCLKNKILGCSKENNHICEDCYQPFTKREDHCEVTNCVSHNEYGCTSCDCGYFLNAQNKCEELQKGCLRYQRGVCTDCHSNFKLRGASCVHEGCTQLDGLNCTTCDPKYQLVEGSCKLRHCLQWNDGNCEVCEQGYRYSKGECVIPENAVISM